MFEVFGVFLDSPKRGVDLDQPRSEEGFYGCRVSSATTENRCDLGRVRIVDGDLW